jgi:hypothetical protein
MMSDLNPVCSGHLTCRANQGHIGIIADFVKPVPETVAGFFFSHNDQPRPFQFVETVSLNFPQFVDHSKTD